MTGLKKLISIFVCIILLCIPVGVLAASEQDPIVFSSPVYLNGHPEYTLSGSAGFTNLLSTAMKEATGADIALIAGSTVSGSLPAGDIRLSQLSSVLANDTLVTTTLTVQQLIMLLNQHMVYGSPAFPQLSGAIVMADKSLNSQGAFTATVRSLLSEGTDLSESMGANHTLTVVTLQSLLNTYTFPSEALPSPVTLLDTFISYMNRTPNEAIALYAAEQRAVILSDTIDPDEAIAKLSLDIPVSVVLNSKTAVTVPDTVMFALLGQNRELICSVVDAAIPYSFDFHGQNISSAANVSLYAEISQAIPPARKTANTFDDNAVFVDLSANTTLPAGTVLTVDIGAIYPPESLVFLYQYDEIGDIVPVDTSMVVGTGGYISFPVTSGTTYVLNSQLLNESSLFGSPSPEHPFILGIVVLFVLFAIWVAWFFIRRKRNANRSNK